MSYITFIIVLLFLMLIGTSFQQAINQNKISNLKRNEAHLIYPIFLFLGLFSALRGPEVGNDTKHYLDIYQGIISTEYYYGYLIRYEIGYVWLNRICGYISHNIQTIIIVSATITTIGYLYFFRTYSKSIYLSILMFICLRYYDQTLNIIRECIAICIILYSFKYIIRSKFIPYCISIIIAFLFHKTAIVFLSAWWISKIKFTKRNLYLIFFISIVVSFQFSVIFQKLLNIFESYSYYDGGQYFGETRIATILMLILQSLFFCISLYIRNKNIDRIKRQDDFMLLLWFVGICILLVSTQFNLLDRVATYFNVFSLVVFPNMLSIIKNKTNKRIITSSIVFLLLTYYVSILEYRPNWNRIYPYEVTTLIKI